MLNGAASPAGVDAERPGDGRLDSDLIGPAASARFARPAAGLEGFRVLIRSCSSRQTPGRQLPDFASMTGRLRPPGPHADRVLVPHDTAHHTQGGSRQ